VFGIPFVRREDFFIGSGVSFVGLVNPYIGYEDSCI
jgi:hypothetical protein